MTNPIDGYPEGYLIYLIKQMELGLRRPFEELLSANGLSMPGYTALAVLRDRPGLTCSELARRSFVRPQTMAETVSALTAAGLLERHKDPNHGRQFLLHITDSGLERVRELGPRIAGLESLLVSRLGTGERSELIAWLRACRDVLAAGLATEDLQGEPLEGDPTPDRSVGPAAPHEDPRSAPIPGRGEPSPQYR